MSYIDFNDASVPIGKRKQAYVKYAVSKGTTLIAAQRQANKKFGYTSTSNRNKECAICRERVKLWDNGYCEHCIRKHSLVSPRLDAHYEKLRLLAESEQTNDQL